MIPSQLKPKYKPLVLVKTDIWNTLRTKTFNKKKWRSLISILKRKKYYKKKPHILNYEVKTVPKFRVYHRYKHQKNLIIRYKIKTIYGSLQDYKIKDLARKAKEIKDFAKRLEQKVPIFLYRIGFTSTYGEAKLHFLHKRVLVNGIYKEPYIKKGDVLHFSSDLEKLFKRRILKNFSKITIKKLKIVGHNSVDFDSSSFRFYFIDNIKYFKNHPFFLPFEKTWRYYTRV
jgi:ribosomal protein S4